MKTIAIYGKDISDVNINFFRKIIDNITNNNYGIIIYNEFFNKIQGKIDFIKSFKTFASKQELSEADVSFFFSIGGDGTMLDAVRIMQDLPIPILGFNIGRLGFLSVVNENDIELVLKQIFNNQYTIQERTLIHIEDSDNYFKENNIGLNEISFMRKVPHSLLTINVWINDVFLNKYWADGLLIATPTGSTAYSLSCGGPILEPNVNSFVLSPVASHNLTVTPIVIPDESTIKVQVLSRDPSFFVSIDSFAGIFNSGSEFTIKKNGFKFKFIQTEGENFFSTLRKKLNWGIDARN